MSLPSNHSIAAWAAHLGVPEDELDPDELRTDLTESSVPSVLARAAEEHGTSTLWVDDERRSIAELADEVFRQAAVLAGYGAGRDTRVVLAAPSSLALVTGYLATLATGATAVLANPAYTDAELGGVVRRSAATLLVGGPTAPPETDARIMTLADLSQEAAAAEPRTGVEVRPDDVALLAFTSGTTGSPKVVPLTHKNLLSSIRGAMWAWRWTPSDVLVHALPLFHQHGLSGIHATLVAGSSAAVLSTFDPQRLLDLVEEEAGTVLFGVPAVHRQLLDLPPERLSVLRRLRLVTSGSGPLSPTLAETFRETTGVTLLERYGLTESGLDVSNRLDGERVPGWVGLPLPGVEVELRDHQGRLAEPGAAGEIVLRGPQVFEGYEGDAAATDASFWPEGWFRTGDLGEWDDAGRLRITGRLKELVITGGMNVAPGEVEGVLEQHPAVSEAAVAGTPSDRWGEEVTAWVVPHDGARIDPGALIAHCREHLAAYKCPKRVFVIEEVPRNAVGKIARHQLTAPEAS